MIMFEQSRRLSQPLRWGRREKTAVAVVVSCVLLALLGHGAYALTRARPLAPTASISSSRARSAAHGFMPAVRRPGTFAPRPARIEGSARNFGPPARAPAFHTRSGKY